MTSEVMEALPSSRYVHRVAKAIASENPCGALLKHWRAVRGMSQLDLAMRAGISSRHLSFVESGRAKASRDMLHVLSEALDVPLRERNALLGAAGYANDYRETPLEAADLAVIKRALRSMLDRLEPNPCTVLDRFWNVTDMNGGAGRLMSAVLGPEEVARMQPFNAARVLFAPSVRPRILNWEAAAGMFVQRLHREALSGDRAARALVDELLAMPGVPAKFHVPDFDRPALPVLPLELLWGDRRLSFFTTITTLGTALDVTLSELRIETYFPADEATERALEAMRA